MDAVAVRRPGKASAMEIIGMVVTPRRGGAELREIRELVQEVKDLTRTLRGSVRSAKQRFSQRNRLPSKQSP